jgi:hypothetical protein
MVGCKLFENAMALEGLILVVMYTEETEQTMAKVNSHNLLVLEFFHQLMFSRSMTVLKPAHLPTLGKEAPNLVDPLDQAALRSLGNVEQ